MPANVGDSSTSRSGGPASSASGATPRRPSSRWAKLPADDPAVYAALQQADTVGLFQVESRAQMATLPRIHPERFYDLVVQVAIIRPGPIVGNMVHPYINRRRGREAVTYPHPSLEPILRRTLGVPLFQEQLLRMAMVAAGFSGSEAEELRRAFGFKRSERRMEEIEGKLRAGMAEKGITGPAADQIVHAITSFALYGFPESHASSFALLAYASAYLRTHHPAAFYAAILNNQPMGFYHPATLVKDAQRHGLRILPIDVTMSDWPCTIERVPVAGVPVQVPDVGASAIEGAHAHPSPALATERHENGRVGVRVPERPTAMAAGAEGVARGERQGGQGRDSRAEPGRIRTTGKAEIAAIAPETGGPPGSPPGTDEPGADAGGGQPGRPHLQVRLGLRYVAGLRESAGKAIVAERAWHPFRDTDDLVRRCRLDRDEVETLARIGALAAFGLTRRAGLWEGARVVRPAGVLFETGDAGPDSRSPLREMTREERVVADYAGTGVSIGPHPMALRRAELAGLGVVRAIDLPGIPHGQPVRVAGSVIVRQRPGTAKGFVFLSLEDETGIANVIVRPWLFARRRLVLVSEPFLLIDGVLQQQDNVVSVRAEQVEPLAVLPCHVPSHDFG